VAFDSKGDLVPHDDTYIKITFDPTTGQQRNMGSIDLPGV
jgi:hypothetical protein